MAAVWTEETTIHGVKEITRNDFFLSRYIWLVMLTGCFCGVSYEVYQVVEYYRSNPSASQVKWVVQESYEYPPMIFCPRTFVSKEKVAELKISESALAYIVGMFQEVPIVPRDFNLTSVRHEVKRLMATKNMTTYKELFASIAFGGDEVLKDGITDQPLKCDLYIPGYGLCYRMSMAPVKSTKVRSIQHVELKYQPPNVSSDYDFVYGTTLLVRDSSGIKADMILLTKNAFYQIDFEVQLHRRLSRPGAECFTSSEAPENYYVGDCEYNCLENELFTSGCKECLHYSLLDSAKYNKDIENIWPCVTMSGVEQNDTSIPKDEVYCSHDNVVNRASGCLAKCLPVCEQWIYKHSTLTFDYHKADVHLRLLYNPTDGILTYEEVPTYTFDTFISNIGGQLGLWLGASVVSIFQIFYYMCLPLCNKAKFQFYKV